MHEELFPPAALVGSVGRGRTGRGVGGWGNQRLRETVTDELRSDLTATLDANVTALEIWATNQLRLASALADEPAFRVLALAVLQPAPTASPIPNPDAGRQWAEYLRARLHGLGYETAHLIDTNLVVASALESGLVQSGWTIAPSHVAKSQNCSPLGNRSSSRPSELGPSCRAPHLRQPLNRNRPARRIRSLRRHTRPPVTP